MMNTLDPSNEFMEIIAGITIAGLVLMALADDYPRFGELLIKIFIGFCILLVIATIIVAVMWIGGVFN